MGVLVNIHHCCSGGPKFNLHSDLDVQLSLIIFPLKQDWIKRWEREITIISLPSLPFLCCHLSRWIFYYIISQISYRIHFFIRDWQHLFPTISCWMHVTSQTSPYVAIQRSVGSLQCRVPSKIHKSILCHWIIASIRIRVIFRGPPATNGLAPITQLQ